MASLRNPRLGFVLTIYFLSIVAFSIMTATFSLFMMFRLGYDAFHNERRVQASANRFNPLPVGLG